MTLDSRKAVFITLALRNVGPPAQRAVTPRAIGQKCDLWRRIPEAQGVVEVKVLQFIRTNRRFACLDCALLARYELGAYFGREDFQQDIARILTETMCVS